MSSLSNFKNIVAVRCNHARVTLRKRRQHETISFLLNMLLQKIFNEIGYLGICQVFAT